jgi:hypothetical protein
MATAMHRLQSVAGNAHGGGKRMAEGNKTQTVYALIRDGKYDDVVRILTA